MSQARSHFRQIGKIFRQHAISNELRIMEYVAFLLLVRESWEEIRAQGWSNVELLIERRYHELLQQRRNIPSPPEIKTREQAGMLSEVIDELTKAINTSPIGNDLGDFFQREVRFEQLNTSGTQYPTPAHINDFMSALAVTSASTTIIDPTAGSGGLIVAAQQRAKALDVPDVHLTAIDFDSQWLGLATANLILNGAKNFTTEVKQATTIYDDQTFTSRYATVVMNPPFGGSRSAEDARHVGRGMYGRTTSTLMAALALNLLAPKGIAALLQPSGTLFSGGGEKRLRKDLIHEHHLEAIITLPPTAMQPYSQVATHLLVARNDATDNAPNNATWLMDLKDDGYLAGTTRDLTEPPDATRDELPRARDVVLKSRVGAWETQLTLDTVGSLQTMPLGDAPNVEQEFPPAGVAMRMTGDVTAMTWDITHLQAGVLIRVNDGSGVFMGCCYHPYRLRETITRPIVFQKDQSRPISWSTDITAAVWSTDLSRWENASENVIVDRDGDVMTLTIRPKTFRFTAQPGTGQRACLFDQNGSPLSPWFFTDDAISFPDDIPVTRITDSNGVHIGWHLDLTAKQGDPMIESTLLLLFEPESMLFNDADGTTHALLDNGWLTITKGGTIQTQRGMPAPLRRDILAQGIAIGPAPTDNTTTAHIIFGVLVPRAALLETYLDDLRPSRFLPEAEAIPPSAPIDILASIRHNQTDLSHRVDALFSVLGHGKVIAEDGNHAAEIPDWITTLLGLRQRHLLDLIIAKHEDNRPRHFTPGDVIEWCKEDETWKEDEPQQYLSIFLQLGIITAVHVNNQNLYRIITKDNIRAKDRAATAEGTAP